MPGGGKEEKASGMKIIVSPYLWFLFLQVAGLLLLLRWVTFVDNSRYAGFAIDHTRSRLT
jgi:hypothetical protein